MELQFRLAKLPQKLLKRPKIGDVNKDSAKKFVDFVHKVWIA